MNIFVGNLSYSTDEDSVRTLFEQHGEVTSVRMITDRQTGRARGFAFVEMPNDEEARAAMTAINGTDLDGRALKVDEAQERSEGRGGGRPRRDERW